MACPRYIPIFLLCLSASTAAAQDADTTNYFPLDVGNSWTYYGLVERHDAPPDTGIGLPQMVGEVLSVNDTVYYRAPHPNGFADTLRDDGEGRIWARFRGRDVLLYDFTLPDSSKYFFEHSELSFDTYEVTIDRDRTVDVVAGHFENCLALRFDIPLAVDDDRTFLFAPNIGLVKSTDGMGEGTYLYSAVVGGKVISSNEYDEPGIPQRAAAYAYPNPFSSGTTIILPTKRAESPAAIVYDILGRTVASIGAKRCSTGWCRYEWDGGRLPGGLYFIRLPIGGRGDVVNVVRAP